MNQSGEIALLAIDGVKPDNESIRSGQYPLATEFYAVTAGSDNPNIQPFLDWMHSAQGQELVEKTGYTSLK
jgi:phosphate transport system substrate-binding protein